MSMFQEVKILTRNYIDGDSTITVSHGGNTAKLYDRDKNSLYVTSGAKRDTITAEVTIIFKVGTTETAFALNNFFLLNTNVKDFTFQRYASGAYVNVFDATVPENARFMYCEFGQITTSRIKILLKSTQYAFNQEKEIGEMIACRLRYNMSQNIATQTVSHREKKQTIELGDGQRHVAYTRFSENRISKYGASATFALMPQVDYDFLEALKNQGAPFLWYPESETRPQEIYYVNWVNQFIANYTSSYKGAGYDLTMELEEV